jgi:hypothetical protein
VQNIVKGATSYAVGDNQDLYSLPVKEKSPSDDTGIVPGKNTPEMNSPVKNSPTALSPDDLYSKPIIESPRKARNSNNTESDIECEGPYAETALFVQSPTRPKSPYDIPGFMIDTTPTTFDLKPPNFKPPPPPPGGSPILRKKKNKPSPPVVRNKKKAKSPQKMTLKETESSPKDEDFSFQMIRSQSEGDLTSEQIFASPSSIGITQDNNNNQNSRHSMFASPREVGPLREYFVYSDEGSENENNVQPGKLRNEHRNGRKLTGKYRHNMRQYEITLPEIVPPPPSSTPIVNTDSLVAPPPPHMTDNTHPVVVPPSPTYPPPRLHPSGMVNVNKHSDESHWQEIADSLPPPPPDMLES